MRYIIVFITVKDKREAGRLSDILLERRLVACVNIVGKIDSRYWWKGKREKSEEYLMFAKTTVRLLKRLIKFVLAHHSYELPEIIAVPIIAGYRPYLDWIEKEVRR